MLTFRSQLIFISQVTSLQSEHLLVDWMTRVPAQRYTNMFIIFTIK